MANPFIHVELNTSDPGTSRKFYAGLFDWKFEEVAGGADYTIINVGEGTGGGMMRNPVPGMPDFWLPYVLVDDVKASTKKAQALGAKVHKDVSEVSGMGWFSVLGDPTGAVFALWQAKTGK